MLALVGHSKRFDLTTVNDSYLTTVGQCTALKEDQTTALKAFACKTDMFAVPPTGFGKGFIYRLALVHLCSHSAYATCFVALTGWMSIQLHPRGSLNRESIGNRLILTLELRISLCQLTVGTCTPANRPDIWHARSSVTLSANASLTSSHVPTIVHRSTRWFAYDLWLFAHNCH